MTDIVERLRGGVTKWGGVDCAPDAILAAADEIERLRAERDALKIECYAVGENYEISKRGQLSAAEIERLRADLLKAELKAELDDLEEIGRLIAIGRREGIEAAAQAAENCLHPSAERTAHAAVDDAVAAIRALLTEGVR